MFSGKSTDNFFFEKKNKNQLVLKFIAFIFCIHNLIYWCNNNHSSFQSSYCIPRSVLVRSYYQVPRYPSVCSQGVQHQKWSKIGFPVKGRYIPTTLREHSLKRRYIRIKCLVDLDKYFRCLKKSSYQTQSFKILYYNFILR